MAKQLPASESLRDVETKGDMKHLEYAGVEQIWPLENG